MWYGMDRNIPIEGGTEELRYIILFLVKASVLLGGLGIIGGIYLCITTSETDCLVKRLLLIYGTLQIIVGIPRFLIYSSYSSGFDAIWTPQIQGEIQRDERKRQITGWTRAATGAAMIVLGLSTLMLYISLFV